MSQTMTLEVRDQLYQTIRAQAEAAGTSPVQVVLAALEQRFNGSHPSGDGRTEAEKQAARERFERHFGSVDLGAPTGIDNEGIDADLAREYGDTHEEK
jgi:hypothetical protein